MATFEFHWKDGKVETQEGKSVSESFTKLGYGAKELPGLDFYVKLPEGENVPENLDIKFQLYIMETEKSPWEEIGKPTQMREVLENRMMKEVRQNGCFSSMIVDLFSEKPVSWIWK